MNKMLVFLVLSFSGLGASKILGVRYLKHHFAHIHQNPSRYSSSLTTISCGHPVKILGREDKKGWFKVGVGPYTGHIKSSFLSKKKPNCFQDKYTKFFDQFKLTVTDFYFWGKLYDNYELGNTGGAK